MQGLQLKEHRSVLCLHRLAIRLSAAAVATSKAREVVGGEAEGVESVIKAAAAACNDGWSRFFFLFLPVRCCKELQRWMSELRWGVWWKKRRQIWTEAHYTPSSSHLHLLPSLSPSPSFSLPSIPTRGRPDVAVTRVVRRRCSVELPGVTTINTSVVTWASSFAYPPALIWRGRRGRGRAGGICKCMQNEIHLLMAWDD